ncbi:protein unc-13 homolog 4B-like [Palaemon carinicauda]|uniref:protein unc-13 homolog 4B-like n=1 Tax=Palaemon carinicauda TaxID=392227 RepID=UPI0035B58690
MRLCSVNRRHEHDAVGVQQLTAVRDIKSFGRLVKGTTQQAKHQGAHLLGKVVLNIKSMSEEGPDGWYPLEKEGEPSKERGTVRLVGKVVSTAELDHEGRKSYDALLTRLVHHEISLPSINNEEDQWTPPWNGRLSSPATAALTQHAIMLGISDAQLQLSWWLVGCRVTTVDAAWALSQLHRVQLALAKGLYELEELTELRSSLSYFVRAHTERLKDLHAAFPSSSGVLAHSQLTYTLKALHSLQTHAASRQLLDQEMIPHIHELVTSSINTHAKNWWTLLVEEQLRGVKTADEQISRVIKIVDEANVFLQQATIFYNAVFLKEMNIPYMQTTYLMVSKKINPCVRPLLMNIYNRMPSVQDQEEMGAETNLQYGLEVGTSLWQLYRNLGRLHSLSEGLAPEARSESGIREYHRWFSRGVMRWLELAIWRAQDMIKKAVELDSFETVDDFCDFSSSATDTTGIFHDVKIWWLKLMWPDPEHSAVLLARILEDICSCATTYSDLLRAKVDKMFQGQANTDRIFITKQICVGLNNIERVRRELTGLPGHFGFDATLDEIRKSINGEGSASQLEATVERLIVSATENMEAKVNEFIEAVIYRFKPTLDRALQEACETQSEAPLLEQVMDPAIQLLHNNLHASNFQRFLWYLWEVLITLFSETVDRNIERRKASYFKGVYDLLEASLKFFSPDEGIGLDPEEARTKEYTELLDFLDSLRMSTESLIAKYYQERHDEQSEAAVPSKAQLVVKMLFTRPGKLLVEVIMARDMVTESDTMSVSSRSGGLHHSFYNQPVDSYVKVQLVPQEWFPSATVRKTKTQRKADPAVYEETFEYDMKKDNDGVCAGLLLFTLKDYNLGRSNTFIGEAVVPLTDLPCVDSSQVHTVPNTYLKMTTPGLDMGYKSLRALQRRTGDKVASSFLKKVSKRLPETKLRTLQKPDDERGRPRSPNLIDRFKFT